MFRLAIGVEGCVCELRKREKKTLYLALLDVSKTYDSAWREGLWYKMRHYGVEEKFVKVCEGLYSGAETRVVMNGAKSRRFGVRVTFVSTLFNTYMMGMVEKLERA